MAAKITDLLLMLLIFVSESRVIISAFNVVDFGANPDGETDSSESFLGAWAAACASPEPAVIYVPPGRYSITQVKFGGKQCRSRGIEFLIYGTLVAPADYNVIGNVGYWILFDGVEGVFINGGTLDGQGAALWNCKASRKDCPIGATSLGFIHSNNVMVYGLTSVNSQLFHVVILACKNTTLQGLNIMAPGNSMNTDGIHVQFSSGVVIIDSNIGTGDDCVSIGPGSTNLWIENIVCGPGHGISIGSLGKDYEEEGVQNVTVKVVTFINTQNGARIKTWGRPSTSFVKDVLFQHALMYDVQNPIIIDQNYCPYNKSCPGQYSGVKISDVTYEDIRGTSATQVGVRLDCSATNPCSSIKLQDVMLTSAAYNVVSYGARGDGKTDSTAAFRRAWVAACGSTRPASVYVPRGYFLIRPVSFNGPCRSRMEFRVDGTIVAPDNIYAIGNSQFWILFYKVNRLSVYGGTIDAKGHGFWACRKNGRNCPGGARSLTIMHSSNVLVSGLTSLNSQTIHIAIAYSSHVRAQNVKIIAPSGSPNTDGIHVQNSMGVTITDSTIRTGDDCISIGPGSMNLWIQKIGCGPGHGISIGSLGNSNTEAGVQNVTVTNSVFTRTQNGVRVKSWARPSGGYARNLIFKNLIMRNVGYPIIIDQRYCPDGSCPNQNSGVKVSRVTYSNIKGTSSTQEAIKFECSYSNPCRGIKLQDINLAYVNRLRRPTLAYCKNARGTHTGIVTPKTCF
nr:polygalacturonase-like [Ipomoea batatas]